MRRRQFFKDAAVLSSGVSWPLFDKNPEKDPGHTPLVISLDGPWLIAEDPQNVGRRQEWWSRPVGGAKTIWIPSIIQEVFPGYHGLAWFWREFTAPENPHPGGRSLLRFEAVDYLAEVWVNGTPVGGNEGGDTPFVLNVTKAIKSKASNWLAVRVLNPANTPIDGIALEYTPHRNKRIPFLNGSSYDDGGIVGSVDLLLVPAISLEGVYLRPDWKTGKILVQATAYNAANERVESRLRFTLARSGSEGRATDVLEVKRGLPPGATQIQIFLQAADHRLWDLSDPYMYRVTARTEAIGMDGFDEVSVRCGFRDFRVSNGYFQLNGRRLFLRSTHTGNHCPVGQILPPKNASDLLRRDLLNAKACGFNTVRFISGLAYPYQLDLCDETGLLVYEESAAAWLLGNSPKMKERYDFSVREMILRDRNHPCVVIWGMLNETTDGPVFEHAVETLQLVRSLDDTRLVLLGSGRFDGHLDIGSLSNPGSRQWEFQWGKEGPDGQVVSMKYPSGLGVGDFHFYPRVPPTPESDHFLRGLGEDSKPVFLSEYGIGSLMDVVHEMRMYEQFGASSRLEDYKLMHSMAENLIKDWERFKLDGAYLFPEDMLADSQRRMARHRLHGFNLIRSNPKLCGFNLTGMLDHAMTGEGVWRFWRDWKPGVMDAMCDGWAPLRWCLFVEPLHAYVGRSQHIEAVLANEDVLKPGEYPVRFRIYDSHRVVWDRKTFAHIPEPAPGEYSPLAVPVLSERVALDVSAGTYKLEAKMESGGSPAGRPLEFYLSDSPPQITQRVTAWGLDAKAERWLNACGVACKQFTSSRSTSSEVILVGDVSTQEAQLQDWRELATRIAQGSVGVFLSHAAFKSGNDPVRWLPLEVKGRCYQFDDWLYHKECVAKAHPIFEGLPSKGILNWYYYGPVWPHYLFDGQKTPDEVVAAAFAAGYPTPGGYASGIVLGCYRLGEGRFILNTFPLLEHLDTHPTAGRLLLNLIAFGGQFVGKPLAEVPANFDQHLKSIGYSR